VDLASQELILPDGEPVRFPIDPFSKKCLLGGRDGHGYILQFRDRIAAYEATHK
jgi:3-isopropylmalate/(R)-2-methylmalate dehydratase small subunit